MSKKSISVKTPKGVKASLVDLSNLGLSKKPSARVGKKLTKAVLAEYARSDSGAGIYIGGNLGKLGGKFQPLIWGGIWMDRVNGPDELSDILKDVGFN